MSVLVLDRSGKPLMPCSEKRARLLLERGRARVHRLLPFVIRLTDREVGACILQPLRLKLDPGSRGTGLALVRDTELVDATTGDIRRGAAVLNLFEPRTRLNQHGFPRGYLMRTQRIKGFATGDLVRAEVPKGKKTGTEVVQGISHRHCQLLQRADGYGYFQQQSLTRKEAGEGRATRTTRSACPA